MSHHFRDQKFAEPPASVRLENEDVRKISERGVVGDDAREADLAVVVVEAEAQRIANGTLDDPNGNAASPVGLGEKVVDHVEVETLRVRVHGDG
jgi:hypothetical protein